jgi:hypothetical protein
VSSPELRVADADRDRTAAFPVPNVVSFLIRFVLRVEE